MRTAYREDIVRSRTTAGRKDVSTVDTIDQVREGMTVVDMTGERVGTVSAVSIGDPQAVTDQGQHVDESSSDMLNELRSILGGDAIPDEQAHHLLRAGFVRVHRLLHPDLFVTPAAPDRVEGDTLHLSIAAD